jgi:polyisoprenoid-binding protein YceI
MSTTQRADSGTLPITAGVWRVDPAAGHLRFRAKSIWGLVPVNGRFASYEGELRVDEAGLATGELAIAAASLDTNHRRRDEHLRSADFFNVGQHPTIGFSVAAVTARPGGLTVAADLHIGATVTRLQLPVSLTRLGEDRLRVQASTSVPRDTVGLTWNRAGMIRGDALLNVELDLVRSTNAAAD